MLASSTGSGELFGRPRFMSRMSWGVAWTTSKSAWAAVGEFARKAEPVDWEGDGWFHFGGEFVADRVYIQGYRVH